MGLDFSKFKKIKHRGSNTIARCPACAEFSNDRKGDHLFIEPWGRFGCVVYPGIEGRKHRQRIFELVGIKGGMQNSFKIRKPLYSIVLKQNVIQKDILGRLGHHKLTYARYEKDNYVYTSNSYKECKNTVPDVPTRRCPL